MKIEDFLKAILALFGFGAMTYVATSAWLVPQTSVYTALYNDYSWNWQATYQITTS